METALTFSSETAKLGIKANEKFVSEDSIVLKLTGSATTDSQKPVARISLKKKFFPGIITRLNVGLRYDTESEDIVYTMLAKKSFELTDDGLTALDLKFGYNLRSSKGNLEERGRIELSHKVFNFTEDQDLKVKLGYDVGKRKWYGQLRENNWTLNADLSGQWNVLYDL